MIELLKELCLLDGVSGNEDAVRNYIAARARPYADDIRVDAIGNLIVFKKGAVSAPNALMIAAHTDEVGVMVTHITDQGYLKFDFVGGVDRRVVIGKPVTVGEKKVPGVIGLKAVHMTTKAERAKSPKVDELYIDIGAKDKESAEKMARVGDYGAFVSDAVGFGNGLLKAKAIDDRLGCAVMLKLLEEDLPMDVTFAFTAQEEVGTRGAFGAAFSVHPETALVLETTTAADIPSVDRAKRVCYVGKGPVILQIDSSTIYDRALFEELRALAEGNGLPWQTKELIAGGNDAKAIQRTREACGYAPCPLRCGISTPPAVWRACGTVKIFCGWPGFLSKAGRKPLREEIEMELLNTLRTLCTTFGPSGQEKEIASVIAALAAPYVDEISRDVLGNLIVHKKGSGPKVMFAAHMDSIGLMVTHITDEGFLRVGKLGGISPRDMLGIPVRFQNGVMGMVYEDDELGDVKREMGHLFIDIGAKNAEEARERVQVGDAAVFAAFTNQSGHALISPYLDNRVSCLALLWAMELLEETDNDLYFVFTTQEEVGTRGAQTAAYAIDSDYAVIADVTIADDLPGSKHTCSSKCGGGAAIKVMDSLVICHPEMVDMLKKLAEEKQIPFQMDVISGGGTDGGPIHKSRAGVFTGGVSVPCRNTHCPQEVAYAEDVEAVARLLAAFAAKKLPRADALRG